MVRIIALLTFLLVAAACSGDGADADNPADTAATEPPAEEEPDADAEPGADATDEPAEDPTDEPAEDPEHEPADPAEVGANELGRVPVLMYHGIVDEPADDWQITPDEFRQELEFLYEHGYYPITAEELARGEIDVPAGRSPVVMTFDDTLPTQFDYDEDGEIASDTAVAIMLEFAEEHPDFPVAGSFYVTDKRFDRVDEGQEMFADLAELGFEVSNHTIGHANLGEVSPDEARRQLALGAEQIREVVPDADVATLSLPLGVWPDDREIAYEGTHEGISYEHEGILLVGAEPAPSPFDTGFDPRAIPRIRSTPTWDGEEADYASAFWLDWMEGDPDRKYVSDGDPETVSFPAHLEDELDPEYADQANPYDP